MTDYVLMAWQLVLGSCALSVGRQSAPGFRAEADGDRRLSLIHI